MQFLFFFLHCAPEGLHLFIVQSSVVCSALLTHALLVISYSGISHSVPDLLGGVYLFYALNIARKCLNLVVDMVHIGYLHIR